MNNWIDIYEGLPEDCQRVYFYAGNIDEEKPTKLGIYLAGCQMFVDKDDNWYDIFEITHWKENKS